MALLISHKDLDEDLFLQQLESIEKDNKKHIVITMGDDLEFHIYCTIENSKYQYQTSLKSKTNETTILYRIMSVGYLDIADDSEKWYQYYLSDKEYFWHKLSHILKMYDRGLFNEKVSQLSSLNYNMYKLCMYLLDRLCLYLIYYSITQLSETSVRLDFKDTYGYQLPSILINFKDDSYQVHDDQSVSCTLTTTKDVLRHIIDLDQSMTKTSKLG